MTGSSLATIVFLVTASLSAGVMLPNVPVRASPARVAVSSYLTLLLQFQARGKRPGYSMGSHSCAEQTVDVFLGPFCEV